MRNGARLAAAILIAASLLGCGGEPSRESAQDPSPSGSEFRSTTAVPTRSGATGSAAPTPVTPVASASTSPSAGATVAGPPVTAALDRGCARAGADEQGLTVRNAQPGSFVGYSTEYSDHTNEVTTPSYTGGYGYGKVDESGGYRATWTVPAGAPAGPAIVRVLYSGSDPPIRVSYLVAAANGSC